MNHIATAHRHVWGWLHPSRRYVDRVMSEPFTLDGSLEGLPEEYGRHVDVVVGARGTRAVVGQATHDEIVADPDCFCRVLAS